MKPTKQILTILLLFVSCNFYTFSQLTDAGKKKLSTDDAKLKIQEEAAKEEALKGLSLLKRNPLMVRNKGANKVFQPFVLNPKVGDNLPEQVPLPDGTTMSRDEYLKQINLIEADLNRDGFSIRDKVEFVEIGNFKNNKLQSNDLQSNRFKILTAIPSIPQMNAKLLMAAKPVMIMADPDDGGQADPNQKTGGTGRIGLGDIAFRPTAPISVENKIAPFEFSFGDPQTVFAGAFAKYELKSYSEPLSGVTYSNATPQLVNDKIKLTNSKFSMYIGAEAKATVLSQDVKFAEASITLEAPSNASQKLHKRVVVMRIGKNIYNDDDEYSEDSKVIQDVKKDSLNWRLANIVIPLAGPVDVRTSFSLTGSAGIEYNCTLKRTGVAASVIPYITSRAVLEGSVGLGRVARVGVGGELTFLEANVTAAAKSALEWEATRWLLVNDSELNINLNLLSGRLYGFAEISIWRFSKRWETNFAKFNGIKRTISLLDENKTVGFSNWNKEFVFKQP